MSHNRFACWRYRRWNTKVKRRRAIWLSMPDPGAGTPTEQWLYWEAQVNRALAKRTKWRRRACADCRRRVVRSAS